MDRLGGSKQTNSLYLLDSKGQTWVLRSVDKDVQRGIPPALRHTAFSGYKRQQISAAHPFAAAVVAALAKTAGIIAPDPVYVVVADDPALGPHRALFAGAVCMLERRDPTPDASPTEATDTVLNKISRGEGYPVMQHQVLQARLLDMLVGDWDRHRDNFRWAVADSAGRKWYYVIPRDRDFALFDIHGFFPSVAKISFEPYLVGFRQKPSNLKKLNFKAREFDKTFLKDLTEQDWSAITDSFVAAMSDEAIDKAVHQLPTALHATDAQLFATRLKARRDALKPHVMAYYRFLHR